MSKRLERLQSSYLTRDPKLQKGHGKDLMDFAENRTKKVYFKNKMRISTVHHPECNQKSLEDWYTKKLGYQFLLTQPLPLHPY